MTHPLKNSGVITVRPLMSVEEVAAALGIGRRTVWRLASRAEAGDGRFPRPLRLAPQTVRWRWQDVQNYLEALSGN